MDLAISIHRDLKLTMYWPIKVCEIPMLWTEEFAPCFPSCEIVPQLDAVVFRRPYLPHFSSKLYMILEHLRYPSDPQLERKRICREVFTLNKWTNMTAYRAEQPELPQPTEIPAARRASPDHIPEGIPIASPTISRAPPVTPASSEPSTLAEPRMAIPISEYRELCRTLQILIASQSNLAQEMAATRARQEQMLTTQAQHTAILRQL
uniref:Uncharacterized protein n=1 Tax=Vitis vinifera TaxID=29760 RepID=A5BJ40_VITVI|nr:hypothetical protein VITISV_002259 [Vitis vinifera]